MTDNQALPEQNFPAPEDNTDFLEAENNSRRREGHLDDIAATQGIICIILAIALVVTNLKFPDTAEEIFTIIKTSSTSDETIFENPLNDIIKLAEALCHE